MASRDKTSVFISYRRDDTGPEAARLEELLEGLQGDVFRDVSDIEVGAKFPKRIQKALDESDVILVLIGEKWADITDDRGKRRLDDPQDFVRREVKYALGRTEGGAFVDVIPVLIKKGRMPKAEQLPKDIRGLAEINGHRIAADTFEDDAQALSKRIDELLERQSQRARDLLDEIDQMADGRSLSESASFYPTAAGNPELHSYPELAIWRFAADWGIEMKFETKESGMFDGQLYRPKNVRVEGTWRLVPEPDGSLRLKLKGNSVEGEPLEVDIPIQKHSGERSYSGRNHKGQYYRMEWERRFERKVDKL
ncbi:MAG: toll/interleukin-1 receptor domain-containing protein [Planctomycetes bacterium]|nr:toll/interleukin-1 receptor domain-containing protein [Planctomycetota bacterium]